MRPRSARRWLTPHTRCLFVLSAALGLSAAARGQTLVVQGGNSPYTYNASNGYYDSLYVGQSAPGTFNQTGGTLNVGTNSNTGGQVFLGATAFGIGTYNLSGGTLNTISTDVGDNGIGVFTLSGSAVHNVYGTDGTGVGSLDLGFYSGSTGTYNLNGGTLTAGYVRGGAGTSSFYFNGGTLAVGQGSNTNFMGNLTHAYVGNGGAVIDLFGSSVTVTQGLQHTNANGAAATDGGLTVSDGGTLTLSGASTYTGNTTVGDAALTITGSVLSGSGATLKVDGATSRATLNLSAGGQLSVGTAYVGYNGTGTFNQTGGTVTASGNLILGYNNNPRSTGTYTLSAGTLNTGEADVGLTGTGTFNQTGGTFTVASGNALSLGSAAGSSGTYNLSGTGAQLSTGATYVGSYGTGVFNQTAGTHTTASFQVGAGSGSSGTYNLGGTGALSSTGASYVGFSGVGAFNQTGGTVTTNGNALYLGYSGGSGTYTLGGAASQLSTGLTYLGYDGTGVFNQTGGTFNAGGSFFLAYAGGTGTYNLGGGTLNAIAISGGSNGTSTFNFNGGTLQASGDSKYFPLLAGLTTANVQAGGARIDTQGFNATVTQALLHDTTGATAATDGGLTKLGSGTLTLSAGSTYTGPTTVSAGTLSVANDSYLGAARSTVNIFGGASLVFTDGAVTTGRTFNLVNASLAPASGGSITYARATVNGGILGAGTQILADGTTLNGVRTTNGTALSQSGGTMAFNNVLLTGSTTFTQAAAARLSTAGDFTANPQTTLTVNGRVDAAGGSISGALTINNGGTVNTVGGSSAPLYLDGSRGTTVNTGGRLNAASGSTVELGGLLVNNGTQSGVLNVNLGGVVRGAGSFGTVNVAGGATFGVNAPASGNGNTSGLAVFRLGGADSLAQTAFVGPLLAAAPGTSRVVSLALGSGSVFAFSVQDARGTAGGGSDTVSASGTLTLAAGSPITVKLGSLGANGTAGAAANFDPNQNYAFVLVQAAGGIAGFDAAGFTVDTSGFQNATGGGSFAVARDGNNLDLVFTPVPEPATWALLGVGGASLLLVLCRRCAVCPCVAPAAQSPASPV